ncbi:MAG: hypothetical protein IK100_07070 [Muribaculaceae bacterium]|nr:hypothetical protein [Muribaculaceae bacterium]
MKTNYYKMLFSAIVAAMLSALPAVAQNEQISKVVTKGVSDSVALQRTSIYFGEEVLLHDMNLSIAVLDSTSIPELDYGMFNVSVEGEGFRFLPHGIHFGGDGATIKLGYDRTRIPSGYTEDDIRTYYYDTDKKNWVALQLVEVDKQQACVVSKTTHFTDMINGVIVAPESPETSAFTPTMMNDIKAADPTSKINIITPPTANNRGSANLQYQFEMPPARNGMQPQVALSYNSDGGSGWAGEGWDISIPSITIDTRWGVPRYNTTYETETYLLNGQMLAMMNGNEMTVAHRTDSVLRQENRQFFMRQGGDFSLIIREGDSIDNYYWVVTDRNGVKYTYGGDANARLSGAYIGVDGIPRTVVAEWKLTRIEEPHGDYMVYEYENKSNTQETVLGSFITSPVYLKNIHVYQKKNPADSVETTTVSFLPLQDNGNIKLKALQANNARYGFLTSSNRLLGEVEVKFLGETLRSYPLEYHNDTTFHKDLLRKITHLDDNGQMVSYQEFDYYNDVNISNDNINQFKDSYETINSSGSSANNILQYLTDTPTTLGGTATKSLGLSFYAGVGIIDGSQWKGNTIGASYSYSHDSSYGQTVFIDLNGDGLQDKVYVHDDTVYYCPQHLNLNDQLFFGNPVKINGITSISKTTSKTHTYSILPKFIVGWMDLTYEKGKEKSVTKTESTEYFSDINGDGLVDFVSKGKVYFNHLDSIGVPTFTQNSSDTPSPIFYNREIDTSFFTPNQEEQNELIQSSPMIDVVRVWQSPKNCNINISGFVQRILPQGQYDEDEYAKADSLHVSIEKNGVEWWSRTIEKGDTTKYYPSSNNFHVNKNDKIFFRVQCGTDSLSNGAFDNVRWSPIINITDSVTNVFPSYLPNGYDSFEYKPEEGAIYDVNTFARIENCNQFNLSGRFIKPSTTDDIVIRIIGKDDKYDSLGTLNSNYREGIVFERIFPSTTIADTLINAVVSNQQQYKNFYFEITSESNVDWAKVKWIPSVTYIGNDLDTISLNVPAHYRLYAKCLKEGTPFLCTVSDSIWVVSPTISFNNQALTGQVTMTVKSKNRLVAKHTYNIDGGVLQMDEVLSFVPTSNVFLWVEYFFDGLVDDGSFSNAQYSVFKRAPQNPILHQVISQAPAYFYAEHQDEGFGLMYRGWGGFAYNSSNGRYAQPIEVSLLTLPQDTTARINPLTMPFNQLGTDQTSLNKWIGPNENIYLTANEAGAARLTEQDVQMINPLINGFEIAPESGITLKGTGAAAIKQISKNSSTIVQEGFLGILTSNKADGFAETKQTMMDMNGDGFPDILSYGSIQYTNSYGGLSGESINIGLEKTKNSSNYIGIGGIPIGSVSNIVELIENGNITLQNAQTTWGAQISVSGGENTNLDEALELFVDINGDGLPDRILSQNYLSNKCVCLNLGYSFTTPIALDIDTIQKGLSITGNGNISGGAGGGILGQTLYDKTQINKASGSFSAGVGFSDSWSSESYKLMDINGDGLPDKIKANNTFISNDSVAFNLGNRFDKFISLNGVNAINESSSTAASANVAFTATINIPIAHIKICANPGASLGYSVNRPYYSLQDVDGDGFIDVVTSSNENELRVKRSKIARTNKLKTVTNSLGGTFTIDYKHNTPTYGLPGGKWVMSSVDIDYGIHGDYEIPNTKNVFEYYNGRRDRHEREFLGFGEVITKNIDTRDMSLYRQTVEEYDTCSIYTAGNLLRTYVAKPTGVKLTEVENGYYSYGLTNSVSNGVNGGEYKFNENFQLWNDRGSAFSPLKYTKNLQYEGSTNGTVMSQSWNSYYTRDGEHGLLKDYRYSDKGTLGNDGVGNYDYNTAIDYSNKLTDTNYYFGHPKKVIVSKGSTLYHLVEATYNNTFPTHLTSVKRAVNVKMVNQEPDGPSGPVGPTGGGSVTNPNTLPSTFYTPDTHADIQSYGDLDYAQTNFEYDDFGNLTRVILPEGSDSTRVYYEYIYEDTLSTYIREVDDIFGLNSIDMSHDFRYGITNLTIDQNGARYLVTNDNVGRMSAVRSPNELDTDNMTMLFEYNPIAIVDNGVIIKPASATTTYYFRRKYRNNINEETDVKSMKITTFVDGFGRVIETRKESNIKND